MFYISGGIPRREAHFGRGSGRIWLDNLQCNGTESSLEYCVSSQWGENNCGHREDAGIECRDDNIKNQTTPEGNCSVYVFIRVSMAYGATVRVCVRSWFYQWYQWYTNIVQGSTNGTIGNTIGTNGTIGKDRW